MTVVVVGAGIAGLACARTLIDAGVPVRVVEREPVVGGRLASVRVGGRWADVGAAYVTADDPAFAGLLQSWRIDGLAHPWTDEFRGQRGTAPMRWSAPGGLRSLAEALARGLDITLGTEVTGLPDGEIVVLAMPGPQASKIADLPEGWRQSWSAVHTAVLTYPRRTWPDFHAAFVNDSPVLATVADDGDRRGDRAPVLVAHSAPAFDGEPAVIARAVGRLLDIAEEPEVISYRWPYAQPEPLDRPYDHDGRVYLCGDAYGKKPRVQTAWLSGRAVAREILRERQSTDR